MSGEKTSIDIQQIAKQLLYIRKANGLKTVLVLGSRAGGLFRSLVLHQTLQPFLPAQLATSSELFAQYYHLLAYPDSLFSPTEIQIMLGEALSQVMPGEADKQLAALIMQGFFDPVITTNADSLLEQALINAGWRDTHEFQVVNLVSELEIRLSAMGGKPRCTIFKVFGDLRMRNYLLSGRYAHMDLYMNLRQTLIDILRRDCLVVGIDEIWDAALLQRLPARGDSCWIVAEEKLDKQSHLYSLRETRNTRYFIDSRDARYEPFILTLYHMLYTSPQSKVTASQQEKQQQMPQTVESAVEQPLPQNKLSVMTPVEIFISYHPKDEDYLDKLVNHLAGLKYERLINHWFKRNIMAGQVTLDEIYRHLNNASIILLLVSADFIAAEDIYRGEVQQAVTRHKQRQARVIPILLRPVAWQRTIFGDLEPLPDNHSFVKQWPDIDSAFLNIVQGIRKVIDTVYQQDMARD